MIEFRDPKTLASLAGVLTAAAGAAGLLLGYMIGGGSVVLAGLMLAIAIIGFQFIEHREIAVLERTNKEADRLTEGLRLQADTVAEGLIKIARERHALEEDKARFNRLMLEAVRVGEEEKLQ